MPIDNVIPVYNACTELVKCVESIPLHTTPGDYRVVLVDDASTDADLQHYLHNVEQQNEPSWLVLHNDVNRGFSYSVNRGIAASDDRDVVLLNSDTQVTSGWLDKLHRCAASDPTIGTVTPLSNNATICSFPRYGIGTALQQLPALEVVNRAIEEAAVPVFPDLPTAVGFCMFIRRTLIRTIGVFDADTFGRGYGEDNDYSLRADAAGFRNVMCDDAFVAHVGERSFNAAKTALVNANSARLDELHPQYRERVRAFEIANPVYAILSAAAARLGVLADGGKPAVLHILHNEALGGTRAHVNALVTGGGAQLRQYVLLAGNSEWILEAPNGVGGRLVFALSSSPGESWSDVLDDICNFLTIGFCHVHHIIGARETLLVAMAASRIAYGVTLHDCYLACPTIALLGSDGAFCGAQTDVEFCRRCLDAQAPFRGTDIGDWRARHAALLRAARFAIAPTQAVADTHRRYFPGLDCDIVPHGMDSAMLASPQTRAVSLLPLPRDGKDVIGVLGALSPLKGARRLERLVSRTRERGLPLRWVLIGYFTDRKERTTAWQDTDKTLTVHGPYEPAQVGALLDGYGIELVAFPGGGMESYSFTLTECWRSGRPALVPPHGALGERVAQSGAGWIMESSDEDRILDQIVAIRAAANRGAFAERASCARNVRPPSIQNMASATARVYRERMRLETTPPLPIGERARRRFHTAATRAREIADNAVSAAVPTAANSRFTHRELPGRNNPCPCGSGKRYKHCCGELVTRVAAAHVSPQKMLDEALRRHQAGKESDARTLYERLLTVDPANAFALHYLGMIHWRDGRLSDAEAMVRQSIARRPGIADFHNNLGLCLSSLLRHDEAIAEYRKALALRPDYVQAFHNLGLSLQETGDIGGAIDCFRCAVDLAPDFNEAQASLELALRHAAQSPAGSPPP